MKSKRISAVLSWVFPLFFAGLLLIMTGSAGNAATFDVQVVDFAFIPSSLNIQTGDTVRWTWGSSGHTVTSGSGCTPNGLFNSGLRNTGFEFTFTFNTPGAFPYFCIPHCGIGMVGSVTVSGTPSSLNLQIDPASVDFGSVTVGQTADRVITITNGSSSTGMLIGTVGNPTDPFSVVSGSGAFSLTPGQSQSAIIRFSPSATGPFNGVMQIAHNATNQTTPTPVPLTGTGMVLDVFADVPPSHWAYNQILAIYDAGITVGCAEEDPGTPENERRYCPEDYVTREQMAALIIRSVEGEPPLNYCDTGVPFPDVTPDMFSCIYIQRLYELKITTGYSDGTYGPQNGVSREEMASFLVRAVEGEPPANYCDSGSLFPDVTPDMWSCGYIKRLKELGITAGYQDGTYGPHDLVTRAQMAAFLAREFLDPIRQGDVSVRLVTVATGLTAPNWGISAPGDHGRLFVTDQTGILWAIDLSTGGKTIFGDLSGLLVPLGIAGPGTFDERGLLGMAFHPQYASNGFLYTFTSEPVGGPADFSTLPPGAAPNCHTVIREWIVPAPANPASVIDPTSSRVLLRIAKPQFNHNGGGLVFGPEGMLYISLGDGGEGDDQGVGHSPQGNGQDTSNVLGKILRIDPRGSNSANGQYGIPVDNPFFPGGNPPYGGQVGCADGICDEIYAYGFRNPFRFSFDRTTGNLYAGDVGQNDIEEVDVVFPGGNYGWRIREGSLCFEPNGDLAGFVTRAQPCGLAGLIGPAAQYYHDDGLAVIGGFVYRGEAIGALQGRYVFGDYSLTFSGNNGRLFFLVGSNIASGDSFRKSMIQEMQIVDRDALNLSVLGFGEDAAGELYLLANSTGVPFGATGVVLKISP